MNLPTTPHAFPVAEYQHQNRRLIFCALLLASLFCLAAQTRAQDLDDATISGRVVDQNDAIVVGATVIARNKATNVERTVTANEEGRYRLIDLAPGAYDVRVEVTGFAIVPLTLTLVSGQTAQLDIVLAVANLGNIDPVFVNATPTVDTTRTVVGGTVTEIEIESLPNLTRAPLDFVFTLPGVSEEPLSTRDTAENRNSNSRATTPEEAGNFSFSGSPAFSNNITIDGLDNNDDRAARERFQPSLEAVAEVQVVTNQQQAVLLSSSEYFSVRRY